MKKKTARLTIAQKNAAFNKLTKPQKRVQIAKDVLAQLNSGFLKAARGVYTDSKTFDKVMEKINNVPYSGETPVKVQDLLNSELKDIFDKDKSCTVCGIGSLFVCAVKRLDKLKLKDLSCTGEIWQEDIHSYLSKYFSSLQLNLIESAFEGTGFLDSEYQYNNRAIKQVERAGIILTTSALVVLIDLKLS